MANVTQAQLRDRLASARWWHPGIPWALAGLGGLAMFGSLIGEWQVIPVGEDQGFPELDQFELGIGMLVGWGPAWLGGALLLATCAGLALVGTPPLRGYARSVGIVLAGVLLGFLVGAAVQLDQQSIWDPTVQSDIQLGRGVYAAFASVALMGAGIFLSGDRRIGKAPLLAEPVEPPADAPDDLAVGPAEPFQHVGDDQTLR
jgi:hypothetical protein